MLTPLRQWIALGVIAFFGPVALRPALAVAAPAAPAAAAPAPAVATPPPAAAAPAPAPYPPPAPGAMPAPAPYPAPYYGQYPPPGYAPYPQYQPYPPLPPPQLVTEHRPRRGLVIGGAVTFGVSWGLAASISLLASDCSTCTDRDTTDVLWIPIAGPVLAGSRDTGSNDTAFWILWSLAELAGVTMFVIGVIGHDVTTYKRVAGRNGPTLQLTPLLARDTSGMALTARW